MSTATILFVPKTEPELRQWIFENAQDHLEIRQAIQGQRGLNLPIYILDPVDRVDNRKWLEDHQSAHNDMNSALGLQANDLSTVDFNSKAQAQAWFDLHWREHIAARSALKI